MDRWIERDANSAVLRGVPRVSYGSYGGCTPYPISLKACAGYLGDEIDYAEAIAGCGAAFRLAWNTAEWDGGNVDVYHTYEEENPGEVYRLGAAALGRAHWFLMLGEGIGKDEFKAFIAGSIGEGVPVIAMGMVGPPEAGLVAGFRDGGETVLGWSVFMDAPEFGGVVSRHAEGYYVSDKWWENGVLMLLSLGERVGGRISPAEVASLARRALSPRMDGTFAKGILAYDVWAAALSNDADFPDISALGKPLSPHAELAPEAAQPLSLLGWRLMCQGDGADCLADGRGNAARYFASHAEENPIYGAVAREFGAVAECAMEMYGVLGGWERSEKQMLALGVKENREKLIALIKRARSADEAALRLLEQV